MIMSQYKIDNKHKKKDKGKGAHSTYYRRIVWEYVIMPLLQEIERPYFSVEEFHAKRDEVSERLDVSPKEFSYGLRSLISRDILKKEKENSEVKRYSVNPILELHMKKKEQIDYGTAIKETSKKSKY